MLCHRCAPFSQGLHPYLHSPANDTDVFLFMIFITRKMSTSSIKYLLQHQTTICGVKQEYSYVYGCEAAASLTIRLGREMMFKSEYGIVHFRVQFLLFTHQR